MKLLLVITGMSGAGKSAALSFFEDRGFVCAANIPANLTAEFVRGGDGPFAVAMDFRAPGKESEDISEKISAVAAELKNEAKVRTIFLDASDRTLVSRYGQTRRNHPLAREGRISEGIKKERALLEKLKETADTVVDTTGLNPHELREKLAQSAAPEISGRMSVNIISFGFKRGCPPDADMIFDVRMLPNPNFTPSLKPLDGLDPKIKRFVFGGGQAARFLDKATGILDFVIAAYDGQDKPYLNVGVGCTGGRHRSVAVAGEMGEKLRAKSGARNLEIKVSHRDIRKN